MYLPYIDEVDVGLFAFGGGVIGFAMATVASSLIAWAWGRKEGDEVSRVLYALCGPILFFGAALTVWTQV